MYRWTCLSYYHSQLIRASHAISALNVWDVLLCLDTNILLRFYTRTNHHSSYEKNTSFSLKFNFSLSSTYKYFFKITSCEMLKEYHNYGLKRTNIVGLQKRGKAWNKSFYNHFWQHTFCCGWYWRPLSHINRHDTDFSHI